MKKDVDFLNYIFKNAEMGIIGIDDLMDKIGDEDFKTILENEREEYVRITKKAKEILNEIGYVAKENSELAKLRSNLMIKLESMKDNSTSAYAKMMIEGTNKGIIEIQEKINNFNTDNHDIEDLANDLLETEENNIEELKQFL